MDQKIGALEDLETSGTTAIARYAAGDGQRTSARFEKQSGSWKIANLFGAGAPSRATVTTPEKPEADAIELPADETNTTDAGESPKVIGQLVLRPLAGFKGSGVAVIALEHRERKLIVQARLEASKNRQAYEIWLYNSRSDARSLGAQVTDRQGAFQGAAPLPARYGEYRYLDVSLEEVDENPRHGGRSVLRGLLSQFRPPP